MKQLQESVKFKNDKYEKPEIFLGSQLVEKNINGVNCWTMLSTKYVTEAIKTLEEAMRSQDKELPSKAITPLTSKYRPELGDSPELDRADTKWYQELIGILRWAVELGRIDILLETSLMSSYMANPRVGHLDQLFHMFA